jgi:multisubunit Na+/H+ antiporter MnhG subunit
MSPDTVVNGIPHLPWVFVLPIAVSRWWDVVFFALWAFALARLVSSYNHGRRGFREEAETISSVVGLIVAVLGTLITACCLGLGAPGHAPGEAELPAVGSVMGAFAAGLIAPVACALLGSVIATIGAGLGAGLRTCWSICLLGGLVAGIVFGLPGGLLYCFVAGGVITAFDVLLRMLISIGQNDD